MTRYHPDETRLTEYAAGSVSYHEALMIAVHLEYCPHCSATVAELQALGGILLDDLPSEPVDDSVLNATLASVLGDSCNTQGDGSPVLTRRRPQQRPAQEQAAEWYNPDIPTPLRKLVPRGFESLGWKKLLPHLRVCDIDISPEGPDISLHRINAGGRIPEHTHRGTEYTVLLRGGFSDALGDYNPGDFLVRGPEHEHQPVAAESEECICLTATEEPLRMTSWKWRWLNPFL